MSEGTVACRIPHTPSVGLQTRVPDAMSLDSVSGQSNGFQNRKQNIFSGGRGLHTSS